MPAGDFLLHAASKNTELLDGLSKAEYASSALPQSQANIDGLSLEIRDCNHQIETLASEIQSRYLTYAKYIGSTRRRYMYRVRGRKDRFARVASILERKYLEAVVAELQLRSDRDELSDQSFAARVNHAELEQVANTRQSLNFELDALYDSVFAELSPKFPGEDQKEWAFYEARDAYDAAKQRHEAENGAFDCLQDASALMKIALEALADSHGHLRKASRGAGTYGIAMEKTALESAQRAAKQVHVLVSQARRLSPGTHGLVPTNFAQGQISDVFFDHGFNDVAIPRNIKRFQIDWESKARRLQQLALATKMMADRLGMEADRASSRMESAKRELRQTRQQILEQLTFTLMHNESSSQSNFVELGFKY